MSGIQITAVTKNLFNELKLLSEINAGGGKGTASLFVDAKPYLFLFRFF